jgi:hypothetical protein
MALQRKGMELPLFGDSRWKMFLKTIEQLLDTVKRV